MGWLKCLGPPNTKAGVTFHSVYVSFLGKPLRVRQVEFLSVIICLI